MEMNTKCNIKFRDGTNLKKVTEAVYLGAKLTKKHLTRTEVENRLGKAFETVRKLRDFFKKSQCSDSWKLIIYNAVVVSRLVYGLDSLELVDSLVTRLDAFQIRGLRHILKIEHSYWSHTSNLEILEKANYIEILHKAVNIPFSLYNIGKLLVRVRACFIPKKFYCAK